MDLINAFSKQAEDLRIEYFHSAKWKPFLRFIIWLAGFFFAFFKNLGRKYVSWCSIKDKYGFDISCKYRKSLDNMRLPCLSAGHYLRFDIEKALKINSEIKRIGLVVYNGIGDYFLCTAFIKHLKNAYPYLAFDAYIPSYRKVLAELTSVNPCFEQTVLFESSLTKKCLLPDLKSAYEKADKDTLVIPPFYDFRPSVHSRYLSLCHNFKIRPENNVPLPYIPLDYALSAAGQKMLSEIDVKLHKMQSCKGIAWMQLTSASANYSYPCPEKLIKTFYDNGWFVVCADKNSFAGDYAINLSTGINDSIKILSLLNEKHKVLCVGILSCFGAVSSGLGIPNLVVQPYWDSRLESVWHGNEFVVFSKKHPSIPDERQFIIKEFEKNPPFNITFSPEHIYSCFEKMLSILRNAL